MSQQTKFCKNCGKELPLEATFCPYCMTKLIDVTTGKEIKIKKKTDITGYLKRYAESVSSADKGAIINR